MNGHLAKAKRVVVKVGSSLLVDSKTGRLKEAWLASRQAHGDPIPQPRYRPAIYA